MNSLRHQQSGAALITALLIVFMASLVATQLASRAVFDNARSSALLERDQAWQFVLAGEAWAIEVLNEMRRDTTNPVDHLNQLWAQPIQLPPFEELPVQLSFQMEDLEGRFNLNNLVNPDGSANQQAVDRFRRLLRYNGLDENLVFAVKDWIDADIQPRFPDGAEDDYYSRLDPPYRTANRPMVSATELRLIRGFDDETYRQLAPWVTALPRGTRINVNTAPPEVLRILAEGLGEADAERLAENRPDDGFDGVDAFAQDPVLAGRELPQEGLAVTSNHFLVRSQVALGRSRLLTESVIHRSDAGTARVLLRRQGFVE
ncbi:MAG: type II secretion system minor pseudopilin GspK [Ectothiorhodospiraceae bacterium]|nr:type II secretion system minor pseudopilin GspK [Ectothiorhodospiraceae bacterium]